MTVEERKEYGSSLKASGVCNCTASVLKAFSDILDEDSEKLETISSGFVAGMGNTKGTCGALVGAIIAAGIITGGKGTVRYSRYISNRFEELSGATICRELKRVETGKAVCSCPDCVKNAITALSEALGL